MPQLSGIPLDSPHGLAITSSAPGARTDSSDSAQRLDPIGIRDVSEAQDEYDSYEGGVYRLLLDGASAKELALHLARIEGERMGLPSSADGRLPVATKLCGLNVKIADGAV